MYNKLFTKILDSSIWLESTPTRIVWMTFIAVMDEDGFCQFASPANVAHRARVTHEEAEEAIHCLENPDADSSDPANEGRRIERVPGGWIVLNAEKHRHMVTRAIIQEQTRERVRRHREKKRKSNASVTPDQKANASVTPSESNVHSDTRVPKIKSVGGDSPPLVALWNTLTTKPIPRCLTPLSTKRARAMALRLKERPDIGQWRAAIVRIESSPFCCGQNDRGWVASFDWLLQPDTAARVLEGKYDARGRTGGAKTAGNRAALAQFVAERKAMS